MTPLAYPDGVHRAKFLKPGRMGQVEFGVYWRFIDNLLSMLMESLVLNVVNELKFKKLN